jgi:hypothetical protein
MRTPLFAAAAVALAGLAIAQEDDVFAFIPDGGRTILERLVTQGMPEDLARAMASEPAPAGTWEARLSEAGLDPWDAATLAAYLEAYAPLDPTGDLPLDGRDLALGNCQFCHIITVTVTQDRTREAWLGTLNSPSHIEIKLNQTERALLADYLVLNAGIPIDQIPPELRAGGASY